MSLKAIVRVLGGDLYDGGRRANVPAPGHSAADRSVSLLLQDNRIVVHAFGDGDWRAVLDDLRVRNLIDAAHAPTSIAGPFEPAAPRAPGRSDLERRATALGLWEAGRPIARSVSARHCRLRGVRSPLPGSDALRHNHETPVAAYRPGRHHRPALLAGIREPDGRLCGVEVAYLSPNGRRADDLRLPRKTIGVAPGGCAVRLDAAASDMLVAEGVFTTLSASERFGLPGWALMSTRNLRVWSAPEGVRSVLIAADRGADGEASAERLRTRLVAAGVAASVAVPPAPWGDWNEWAQAQPQPAESTRGRKEGGREG